MGKERKIKLPHYSLNKTLDGWDDRHRNAWDYNAELENAQKTCDSAILTYIKALKKANPDVEFNIK